MRAIRVLRGGVNIVDQIRAVLVGCHVSLVLHVLVLGTVEVPSEVHSWLGEEGGLVDFEEGLRRLREHFRQQHIDFSNY